ncbi:hypothetical protein MTYP_00530 [Methylophilaceae bacterium]|nr:hypothetical protein MTYP_00530 [Methylophilaceae bacterium]
MKHEHKQLKHWQAAMQLAEDVCGFTSIFPKDERLGLASQLRHAAGSTPSDISEGAGRKGTEVLQGKLDEVSALTLAFTKITPAKAGVIFTSHFSY